jgi:hypothetical protein
MQQGMERLCTGWGIQGVGVLLIPGGFLLFLLPSVAQASQEDF